MNAHELNIASAIAHGTVVDMDPRVPSSALLQTWLRAAQELRDKGRPVSVATLSEYASAPALPPNPSPKVLDDSIENVETASVERRVRAALESKLRGHDFLSYVAGVTSSKLGGKASVSVDQLVSSELAAIKQGVQRARFVPTGITEVDRVLGGLPRGVVTVLGARPGVGKSASALACADGASAKGLGVHVFSLEDPAWRYAHRLIARRTGIPVSSISLAGSAAVKVPGNWLIDDTVGHTARSICRAARARAKTNDTKLVVVDYVQLLRADDLQTADHTKLASAMAELTGLARDLDAAVVAVSQLNRHSDERDRPSMADLKASGSIEEVAKLVVLISRPNQEESDDVIEWIVAKNNFGKVQTIPLSWDGATCRIW